MVEKIKKDNQISFACSICKFRYKDNKTAEKCEDYCKKYKSCSLEITKLAIR